MVVASTTQGLGSQGRPRSSPLGRGLTPRDVYSLFEEATQRRIVADGNIQELAAEDLDRVVLGFAVEQGLWFLTCNRTHTLNQGFQWGTDQGVLWLSHGTLATFTQVRWQGNSTAGNVIHVLTGRIPRIEIAEAKHDSGVQFPRRDSRGHLRPGPAPQPPP